MFLTFVNVKQREPFYIINKFMRRVRIMLTNEFLELVLKYLLDQTHEPLINDVFAQRIIDLSDPS